MRSREVVWTNICSPAQVEFAVEHIFVHTASRLLFGGAEDGVTRKNLVNPLKMRMDYDY